MKRSLMLLLSSILFAVLLVAGCSNQQSSTDSGNNSSSSDSNTSDSSGTSNEPVNLKITMTDAGVQYVEAQTDISENEYIKKLEELTKTELTFEMLPWQDYKQSLSLVFAGGELPDLMQNQGINTPEIAPAIENGVFMPLNDLIEKHAPNLKKFITDEQWNSAAVSKDGKIYAIPKSIYVRNGTVVMVREDWMEKLGLEDPKTIDEYIDMLRAFRDQDPDGNGKDDSIPFSARENFAYGEIFFGAYDVIPGAWEYIDGKLIPNFIRPEMKDALKVYRTLYEEKLLDNEFLVQQGKDWDAKIKGQGIVGMWTHSATYPDKWLAEVQKNTPTGDIDILPAPIGPDGKGGLSIGSSVGMVWSIPADSEKAVEAIKFLDRFYDEDVQKLLTFGLEGRNHTIEDGKIKYKYPTNQDEIYEESMYNIWMRFIGPSQLQNKEFMAGRPHGDLISKAIEISRNEGRVNDGLGMPALPTLLTRPELQKNGLFIEFAAKVVTGKLSVDEFDNFVADWKERGGDKVIEEATEWYNSTH